MIRQASLAINYTILDGLRAAAELLDLPSAEHVAEQWLLERLSTMPGVQEKATMRREAKDRADREWRKKWLPKEEEVLP